MCGVREDGAGREETGGGEIIERRVEGTEGPGSMNTDNFLCACSCLRRRDPTDGMLALAGLPRGLYLSGGTGDLFVAIGCRG